MAAQNSSPDALWDVPYLPIDPRDIGRTYEAIIRINAQSGKGGVAYVLEHASGLQLPKEMHAEFGRVIQALADAHGDELSPTQLFQAFEQEYVHHTGPYQLTHIAIEQLQGTQEPEMLSCVAHVQIDGVVREVQGRGNNPVMAFANALIQGDLASFTVESYAAHTRTQGSERQEVVYVHIRSGTDTSFFGVAIETEVAIAAAQALVSALNRADSRVAE